MKLGAVCVLCLSAAMGCGSSEVAARDAGTDAGPRLQVPVSGADAGEYVFPCFDLPPPTHQPTFMGVYQEVFCVAGCANLYCHSSRGESGSLDLEAPNTAYEDLVGASAGAVPASGDPGCSASPLLRVEPGHPERSLLYLKVSRDTPPCGSRMPLDLAPLTPTQLTQIRTWIENGALDDRKAASAGADAGL